MTRLIIVAGLAWLALTSLAQADHRIIAWNVADCCPLTKSNRPAMGDIERCEHIEQLAEALAGQRPDMLCLTECETISTRLLLAELRLETGQAWDWTTVEQRFKVDPDHPEPRDKNIGSALPETTPPTQLIFDDDIVIMYDTDKYELRSIYLLHSARSSNSGRGYANARAPLVGTFHSKELQRDLVVFVVHAKAQYQGKKKTNAAHQRTYPELAKRTDEVLAQYPDDMVLICGDWNSRFLDPLPGWYPTADDFPCPPYTHVCPTSADQPTYISDKVKYQNAIDHMVIGGNFENVTYATDVLGLDDDFPAEQYSDHRPLLIDMRLHQ